MPPTSVDAARVLHTRGNQLFSDGRHSEALECFDQALALEPDSFGILYNRGLVLRHLGRDVEAISSFDRALAIRPRSAPARTGRADSAAALGHYAQALAGYRRALALDPYYAHANNNLGRLLQKMARYGDALARYDRALADGASSATLWSNRGTALVYLNRPREAVESFRRAVAMQPGNADFHWYLSLALLSAGDFTNGWVEYEWRWQRSGFRSPERHFTQPQWRGNESLDGKTLLLHAEQGFGDAIQFARYAPLAARRGAHVILEAQRPLKPLFDTLEGVARIAVQGEPLPPFDLHCPLLSLPLAFGTTPHSIPAEIPYLKPRPEQIEAWQSRLGPQRGLRVGICWAGNPTPRHRSIPLPLIWPLVAIPGILLVGLQKDLRDGDAQLLASMPHVFNLGAEVRDFAQTAALVSLMDLVITIDTSVLHVAGALGRPLWALLPFAPDWRWPQDRDDSPWYPGVRRFQQAMQGRWEPVIKRVAEALAVLVQVTGRRNPPRRAPSRR